MASGGSSQSSYDQEPKKECRKRLIEHAVKCLTTGRETSACVDRDHVRKVWQQLIESGETSCFTKGQISDIEKEIKNWELFHKSQIQTREPSDLRVCYLAGDNPMNDLEVLIDNGVLYQNIWAIEKDPGTLKAACKSIEQSTLTKNVRLFNGDFLDFLKDVIGQFDIIYFDACGTLPSAIQKTLKAIGYIFLYNKLTSPGALITTFSFPPEDKDKEKERKKERKKERENLRNLSREYLTYRLENTLDHNSPGENKAFVCSRSDEENYSDYISYQIIDTAYMYIPALRMISSKTNSLWGQVYDKKYDFLKSVIHRKAWKEPTGFLSRLGPSLESHCSIPKRSLCNTWVEEVLPDWKSQNALKNYQVSSLLLTHLLTNSNEFIHSYCHDNFLCKYLIQFLDFPEKKFPSFHDVADQDLKKCTAQRTCTLLYGQMVSPSFPVVNKILRLKYTAKQRQMFSDVFIFDKCRYVYNQFPSVDCILFAVHEPHQQMVFRMVVDGLRKHLGHIFDDLFKFCDVSSIDAVKEGGVEFSNCLHHIPNRLPVCTRQNEPGPGPPE